MMANLTSSRGVRRGRDEPVCVRAKPAPSTFACALRFRDDKRAARAPARAKTSEKPRQKNLRNADFTPGARCALVTTDAQRSL